MDCVCRVRPYRVWARRNDSRRSRMSLQYLYRIRPTRSGFLEKSTPDEDAIVDDHFEYLKSLTGQGVVLMAGRTLTTHKGSHGIVVLAVHSADEARGIMENDPAVRAGVFSAELFPFRVALASQAILQPSSSVDS
jgi:uncharacterized protein